MKMFGLYSFILVAAPALALASSMKYSEISEIKSFRWAAVRNGVLGLEKA